MPAWGRWWRSCCRTSWCSCWCGRSSWRPGICSASRGASEQRAYGDDTFGHTRYLRRSFGGRDAAKGADAYASARQQWDSGNNPVALSPAVVVAYDRNTYTNTLLRKEGIDAEPWEKRRDNEVEAGRQVDAGDAGARHERAALADWGLGGGRVQTGQPRRVQPGQPSGCDLRGAAQIRGLRPRRGLASHGANPAGPDPHRTQDPA